MPNTYFTIPFQQALGPRDYTAWFASWTRTLPEPAVNAPPLFVVGVTQGELPQNATLLGEGFSDRPGEQPPPAPPSPMSVNLAAYRDAVGRWLSQHTGAERFRYFATQYSQIEKPPSYIAWFATWSKDPPAVASGMPDPFVIGFTAGNPPTGATILATDTGGGGGGKDPPAPPPAAPMPGSSLDQYRSCLSQELAPGGRWAASSAG